MNEPNFGNNFPSFTYFEGTNDMDLDFNMLSEYLLVDEDPSKLEILPHHKAISSQDPKGTAVVGHEDTSDDDSSSGRKRRKISVQGKKEQMERRRERNKVLARKTRLRKKFFYESLQKQVSQLAVENEALKNIVRLKLKGEVSSKILADCKSIDLPPIVATQSSVPTAVLEKADFSLIKAIQAAQRSFVITDPSLPDNPIIFASQGFLDLCGYKLDEVLGRNCRFLQGPNTDPKQVEILREGILAGRDTSVCLLNYRADGSQFYNQIFLAALRNSSHKIINYVGVQVEVDAPPPNCEFSSNSSMGKLKSIDTQSSIQSRGI